MRAQWGSAVLRGGTPLRAYDAVQLATGKAVRSVDPGCSTFAVFDKDLRGAAALEGFALLPER
ncbi:hypothetical protein [Nocardiopsis sp. FIRDI 009]|uniref:hypothetical protein n=1 Tax=Nocardiopsis sp. FIRDI 009 TaxID=714197 RepID=UPI001E527CE9|nr:hypothetical protein [Nocardiopsis sp. FIRDI 009]